MRNGSGCERAMKPEFLAAPESSSLTDYGSVIFEHSETETLRDGTGRSHCSGDLNRTSNVTRGSGRDPAD